MHVLTLRTNSSRPGRWQTLLSVIGMALVLLSGTLSATHSHAHAIDDHGTCSLCVSAHAVAQVASAPAEIITLQVFQILEAPAPIVRPRTVVHTAYFTRPPPAGDYLA